MTTPRADPTPHATLWSSISAQEAAKRLIRDGQNQRIAASELVVGDMLLLAEGNRVAADGWLLQVENLMVDESLLTGESVPVSKQAVSQDAPPP